MTVVNRRYHYFAPSVRLLGIAIFCRACLGDSR
jgi:hypothetical protein